VNAVTGNTQISGAFGVAAGRLEPMVVSSDPDAATITVAQMRDQPAGGTARWMFEEAARQNGFDPADVVKGSPEDAKVTATLERSITAMASMPKTSGQASEINQLRDVIAAAAEKPSFLCSLPTVGGGGSIGGYDILGGGVNGGVGFDPKTGRLGVTGGVEVGVGAGARAKLLSGSQVNASLGSTNGVSASVGVSANVQVGPVAGGVSHELIGTSMKDSAAERTQVSVGAGGVGFSANANLNVGAGFATQLYNIDCPK